MIYTSTEKYIGHCQLCRTFPVSHTHIYPIREQKLMFKNVYCGYKINSSTLKNTSMWKMQELNKPSNVFESRMAKPGIISPGCKVFVEKESIIPRDLIRNSKYTIVLDRDKADVIVVPTFKECEKEQYDAIAKDRDGYVVIFEHNPNCPISRDDESAEEVEKELKDLGFTDITLKCDMQTSFCYFIPRYECYTDIFEDKYPNRMYIEDTKLPIAYPNQISLELLKLWKNIDDPDLMAKLLISSNIADYPITLMFCLSRYWQRLYTNDYPRLKTICQNAGYDWTDNFEDNILAYPKPIQPEDWNIVQKLILDDLGVSEQGGYASSDKVRNRYYDKVLRVRTAVKPLYIDTEISPSTLLFQIKTSNGNEY